MSSDQLKDLFQEPEHQPFLWKRGDAAALLVHGYTGTPGEVRQLAGHCASRAVSGLVLRRTS